MNRRAVPWLILVLAALLRLMIALFSIGSNDALIWQKFGRIAWSGDFYGLWVVDPLMNHPPLTVRWAELAYGLAGESTYRFSLLMKLPALVGDLCSTWLIWRIVGDRTGRPRSAQIAALLFALSPASLLVTGFHCNVDSLLAMFLLLTWWLADRRLFFAAGLALGAAINVKLAAAPTIFLLLACTPTIRHAVRAVGGLALMALPFAWMTLGVGTPFLAHTLGYRPDVRPWLLDLPSYPADPLTSRPLVSYLQSVHDQTAVQVTFLIIVALAVWQWRGGRNPLTIGAIFWSAFLFWNGGVLQYAVWPLPLLAAVRPRIALAYSVAAGVWLAWSYFEAWRGGWPLLCLFPPLGKSHAQLSSVLPISCLIFAIIDLARAGGRYHVPPSGIDSAL